MQRVMWQKFARMPLKWKVLLCGQVTITAVLIKRRLDPQTFDSLFEKRVLIVTKKEGGVTDEESNSGFFKGYEVTVKKEDSIRFWIFGCVSFFVSSSSAVVFL